MTNQTDCPLHETLVALASGTLSDGDGLVVADHVENCERCEEILVAIESATLLVELQPAASAGEFTERFVEEARCHDFVNAIVRRSKPTLEPGNRKPLSRRRIRDYELLGRLGHGAMGTVFKARHTRLNKLVAIKLLSEKLSKDVSAAARFQREMQAVGQLNDPHIVQALDAGDDDGVLFLVMELAEGLDVARIAPPQQSLEVADACEIVRQTAIGMQHAHAQGLIHRDIKPSNLMLTLDKEGQCCVKILDLGLATFEGSEAERHLTDEGQLMGTLEFMAPEQAEDTHTVDSRADVYSLGATLYRLLTGTVPLAGPKYDTPLRRLRALASEPVPGLATRRNDLPEELVVLVDRMLSREPAERPQDMAEVARLLESFAAGHSLEPLLKRKLNKHQKQNADGSFIDELRDTEPSLGETVELASRRWGANGETRPVVRTRAWPRSFRWQVTGVLGVVALLLSIFWIRTDGGYIRIETSDPSIVIAVELLKDQKHVDTIAIGRDRKQYWYRTGDYEVRLPATAEDQFQIDGGNFTLTRGTDRTVRISRVAEPEVPPEIIVEEVDTSLIVVTSKDDGADTPGSLRRAISKVASGGTVRFAPQLSGETIVLSGKPLKIVNDVTIDGAQLTTPVTIDGNQRSRIFDVLNRSKLTVNDVKIARGRDYAPGSGIRVIEASLTMRNCVVEGCSNSNDGGGIFCQNGVLLLENCLVIGNTTDQLGGGLANYGGQCRLRNCLLTQNSSGQRHGGAILNVNSGKMELIHCTVAGNVNSGISSHRWSTLIFESSIVAGNVNREQQGRQDVWIQRLDGGGIVTRGINLIGILGADVKSGPKPIIGDAKLYPLADYGGPFPTMPPMPGSKAIDAATISSETPSTDIRGVSRPVDGKGDGDALPDIGAVEFRPEIDERPYFGAVVDGQQCVMNPLDLQGTEGARPSITLTVTNMSETPAMLHGWIDFNRDGQSDPATEEAEVAVSTGLAGQRLTLTFPAIPQNSAGQATARFRLRSASEPNASPDTESEGEVEEYRFTIASPTSGQVLQSLKIASSISGGPALADKDEFGTSLASLGDLDGDGVPDLAVGAVNDDTEGVDRGAVHILLLNADGSVKNTTKIASGTRNGPVLNNGDYFGGSIANMGDLNGDRVVDLAVGGERRVYGNHQCSVWLLFMNSDGTVKSTSRIGSSADGIRSIISNKQFGRAVASLGDVNGDGVADIALGDRGRQGVVYVLLLNADGSVRSSTKINDGAGGLAAGTLGDEDRFGQSVAGLGDLDGDGVPDLAVGALLDSSTVDQGGAVYVLLLNADGSAKATTKISGGIGGGPVLSEHEVFGTSVTVAGDLDGDGVMDLAVGAERNATGGSNNGAVYLLLLNRDGTVKRHVMLASDTNGGPSLKRDGRFGSSVVSLGDLNGDGTVDLAVGANQDSTAGLHRGAVYILHLAPLDKSGTDRN